MMEIRGNERQRKDMWIDLICMDAPKGPTMVDVEMKGSMLWLCAEKEAMAMMSIILRWALTCIVFVLKKVVRNKMSISGPSGPQFFGLTKLLRSSALGGRSFW